MDLVLKNSCLLPTLKLDDQKFEFIFLLDRSGSMTGVPLQLTKEAIVLYLHSLPKDSYFNIFSFGLSFEMTFPQSVKYSEATPEQAKQIVSRFDASLNNSTPSENLFDPIQKIYSSPQFPGYLTQMFVLSDGDINRIDEVLGIIKKTHSRIFTLGLGAGARMKKLQDIAVAGGGMSDQISQSDKVHSAVLNQLKISLKPGLLKPIRVL